MKYTHITIFRPSTGTRVTVEMPFEVLAGHLTQEVATQLNAEIDHHFPGFQITGFVYEVEEVWPNPFAVKDLHQRGRPREA